MKKNIVFIPTEKLYNTYVMWRNESGEKNRLLAQETIGRYFSQDQVNFSVDRSIINGLRVRGYQINECAWNGIIVDDRNSNSKISVREWIQK